MQRFYKKAIEQVDTLREVLEQTGTITVPVLDDEGVQISTKIEPVYETKVYTDKTFKLNSKDVRNVVSRAIELQDTPNDYGTDGLIATSYKDLIDKAISGDADCKYACLDTLATEIVEEKDRVSFISLREWIAKNKPPHSYWRPKHIWFGIDPEFNEASADVLVSKLKDAI